MQPSYATSSPASLSAFSSEWKREAFPAEPDSVFAFAKFLLAFAENGISTRLNQPNENTRAYPSLLPYALGHPLDNPMGDPFFTEIFTIFLSCVRFHRFSAYIFPAFCFRL